MIHYGNFEKEMYEMRLFNSLWEYRELRRMLSEAMSRGYVEQIAVMKPHRWVPNEEWYRQRDWGNLLVSAPGGKKQGTS
jgi:hypothetical protein